MSEWVTAWLPLVTALVLLIAPGAAAGFAAGLRAMPLLVLAPVLSLAITSVSAVAAPYVGLGWGPVPVIVGTMLTAVASWVWRAVAARRVGYPRAAIRFSYPMTWAAGAALVVGGGVIIYRLARIFENPSFVSQTADNVFHLNAVRYVLDTGNASSLVLGAASGGTPSFYPGAWHGLAALVADISGSPIPAAVSCLNLIVGGVVWPLSMWFFCRTIFGESVVMNVALGVLISCFSAYPYLLIDWGVIYPNYLGIAAVPAILGITVLAFRNSNADSHQGVMLPWLGLVALAGVTLSHPNSLLTLIVLVLPYLVSRLTRRSMLVRLIRPLAPPARTPILLSLVVAGAFAVAWFVLRPFPFTSFHITWPPYQSTAQAVGEVIFTIHSARKAAWATGALLIVGVWLACTHRGYRWLAWCLGIWGFLMIVVTAWQPSLLRAFLTGGWYDDYKRVAAGLVLITLPLSVLGFVGLHRLLKGLVERLPKVEGMVAATVSLILIAVPTAFIAHTGAVRDAAVEANKNYSLRPGSPIMSQDEFDFYEELPVFVPEDKVIAGNPWDGSAWAYLVSGRHVLFPHVIPFMDTDKMLIANSFRDALSNPEVCAAAQRLKVKYAINSDELIYLPGNPNNRNYPGLEKLEEAPGFKEIARLGANRLYELEGC